MSIHKFSTGLPRLTGLSGLFFLLSWLLVFNNQAKAAQVSGDEEPAVVYYFQLHEDIMPNAKRLVGNALSNARSAGADVVVMELNTYGGRVDIADSIRTMLLQTEALTVSYIVNNAASAGALISIACDSIYMKREATIGAVTVVNQTGEQMPDKYQSYMRSKMRATAEAQGRDPDIAEAMVDDRIEIPGIVDSGEVLTFTASEALEYDFCDGITDSLEGVLEMLGIRQYEIVEHEISGMDKVIGFLLNPIVSSILMLMIFGGIYFELQTPGVGFPLIAALIGAVLYFAPLYLEGMAQNWEIILFFVGLILLGLEIFLFPGFGFAGATGIALIVGSLTLSMVENNFFDFSLSGMDEVGYALMRVVITLFAGIAMIVAFGGSMFNSPAFKRISLQDEQRAEQGFTILKDDFHNMIGSLGIALTDLRPSGKIEIESEVYDSMSEGGYIEKGSRVKVLGIEANTLIVRNMG